MADPASLDSLRLSTDSIVGGAVVDGTVYLTGPAPDSATISLECDSASVSLPSSIVIPAKTRAGGFKIDTSRVDAHTTVEVKATYESVDRTAPLTLLPPVSLVALVLAPTAVTGGSPAEGTVRLSGPAPSGGITVELEVPGGNVSVPGVVSVAENATSATFAVATTPVGAATRATIFATYGDSSVRGALAVAPPVPLSLSIVPAEVGGGGQATATLTLNGAAPPGGTSVAVTAAEPVVSVPRTVVVAAGATSATFPVGTGGVASRHPVAVNAGSASAALTIAPPQFKSLDLPAVRACTAFSGSISLTGPAPPGGIAAELVSPDGILQLASASVAVPAGAASVTFPLTARTVAARTSAGLQATCLEKTLGATVSLDPPLVSLTVQPESGSQPSSASLTVTIGGKAPAGAAVELSYSEEGLPSRPLSGQGSVRRPGSLVIPEGASSASTKFQLRIRPLPSPIWPDDLPSSYVLYVRGSYQGSTAEARVRVNW